MNASTCTREEELVRAMRSGSLSAELRSHVAECSNCTEVLLVAQFLRPDEEFSREIALPDASVIWRQALLQSRAEAADRATRPIRWVMSASFAAIIAALVWLIFGLPGGLVWSSGPLRALVQNFGGGVLGDVSFVVAGITMFTAVAGATYVLWADKVPDHLMKT